MSAFLAIDTSGGTSVAIVSGGDTLSSFTIDDTMGHSENIGNAILEVLHDAELTPNELTGVVVGRGPAPFTGLRVGLAAAIAFAEGTGKPLIGVTSHDAIAFDVLHGGLTASPAAPLLVVTDARRKEVYWTLYSGVDASGAPIVMDGPHVNKPDDLEELLTERNVNPVRGQNPLRAECLAFVAMARIRSGLETQDVSALYLRAPDAVEPKSNGKFGKQVSS